MLLSLPSPLSLLPRNLSSHSPSLSPFLSPSLRSPSLPSSLSLPSRLTPRVTLSMASRPIPLPPQPGQESVWAYPRPPLLEREREEVKIVFNGQIIARTCEAYRVLETSHPPVYYLPQKDLNMQYIHRAPGSSFCEWKGSASYWSVSVGDRTAEKVGWSYENPTPDFVRIKSHVAFYCAPMDSCTVGGVKAEPQPGGFYGGWVTPNIVGPFKGGPGSWGW